MEQDVSDPFCTFFVLFFASALNLMTLLQRGEGKEPRGTTMFMLCSVVRIKTTIKSCI